MNLRDRGPRSTHDGAASEPYMRSRLLAVSEDPGFIEQLRAAVAVGVEVVACLGPAGSHCVLEDRATCPLVERSSVVLVDEPPGGVFRHHLRHVPARDYAEELQSRHPSSTVLLTSGDISTNECEDGIPSMARTTALSLLRWLLPDLLIMDRQKAVLTTGGGR